MPTRRLTVAKIALGPILLVQGRRARRETLKLPEPEGPRAGVTGSGPPLRILVVGDSSAAGVGVAHQRDALLGALLELLSPHHAVTYRLCAKTGDTTAMAVARLRGVQDAAKFDVAVTGLGVNDVTQQLSLRQWIDDQRALRSVLRAKFGVRHLVISGIPPMAEFPALPFPLRSFLGRQATALETSLQKALADETGVTFVPLDFFSPDTKMAVDGFHPSAQVYSAWAEVLAQHILHAAADARSPHTG